MDMVTLREGFMKYFKKRFPNDNHPGAGVSMAFFLQRNEQAFRLNFQDILEKGVIPDSYRLKLENFFIEKGHKNPKSDSGTYERYLRLLLEYLHSTESENK